MKHRAGKDIQQDDVSYQSLASVHMIVAAKYKWYCNVGSDCMQTHWTYELEDNDNMEECDSCYTCLCFFHYHNALVHF